ncbi:MAG TPA: hydroxyisourate hydrolase [Chitinophagaceae bacterium]|nr:hydroxyisourate hydrolase [Chitinophagaceae bacterium]
MSQVTTHILDTTTGRPAEGVTITLYGIQQDSWQPIGKGMTNRDGRIADLLDKTVVLPPGAYKMAFEVAPYFERTGRKSFYPFVEIVFTIDSNEHYHIPLLLNPFGYTTYRGS